MPRYTFIWDDQDNVPHLAEHGVEPEEAAYVVEEAPPENRGRSRSSGRPVAFGYSPRGRFLIVVYRMLDRQTVYVETAYDVPPPARRRRRRSK